MDIDKLAPVVGIIIWVVFGVFFKGKKRNATESAPRKSSGGFGELSKTLRKVFEEMQGPVQTFNEDSFPSEDSEDRSEEAAIEEQPVESIAKTTRRTSPENKKPQEILPVPVPAAARAKLKKSILRQGFIMSEILSPPVSLRE